MLWWSLLIALLLLLVFILLAPLSIYINTNTHEYYAQIKGLLKASVQAHTQKVLRVDCKVFFLHFYLYPLQYKKKTTKKALPPRKRKRNIHVSKANILKLLRSFTVKKWLVDIDTGDCIANEKLFPVCWLLNYTKGTFSVNFEGRNQLVVHLQNRPIYILRSFI